MALSTTIIRFSPTPPVDPDDQSNLSAPPLPKSLEQAEPQHSKSLDTLPAQQRRSPEQSRTGSALSCSRSQSECNYHCPGDRTSDLAAGYKTHKHFSESNVRQLTKVDSGYCSNLNIQQTRSMAVPDGSQQWGTVGSVSTSVYAGGLGVPPSFSEGFHYVPIPSFKTQCSALVDIPNAQLHNANPLYNSQLAQQYLGSSEAPLHPGTYTGRVMGTGLYISSTGMLFLLN